MKFLKKFFAIPELYCVLILLLSIAAVLACRVTVKNVVLQRGNTEENVSLPIIQKMDAGELFQVDLDIAGNVSYDLRIVPDDCTESIIVNGQQLNLAGIHGLCDFSKGFILPDSLTAPHRVGDKTHYIFYLKNNGGDAGLNIFVLQSSAISIAMNVVTIFSFALLCLVLARRFKFGWGLAFVIFAAVLFRAVFFANVPYTTYSNDVDGLWVYQ